MVTMSKPAAVLLVLALLLLTQITCKPPTLTEVLLDNVKEIKLNQCMRKEFIEKGELNDYLLQLKPDTDRKALQDILIDLVTRAIRLCSLMWVPVDDLEFKSSDIYLCNRLGILDNLYLFYVKNWQYLGADDDTCGNSVDDPLELKIFYGYYGKVDERFRKTYIKLPLGQFVTGSLHVRFAEFNIELTLTIDSITSLMEKLSKKECFLHIKHFQASLAQPSHDLTAKTHWRRYELCRNTINNLIFTKEAIIKEAIINKVEAVFYKALVSSGQWVCLDGHVQDVMDKKLIGTRQTISTAEFKTYCSESNKQH